MLGQLEMFHRQHQGHKSGVQKAVDQEATLPPRVQKDFEAKEQKAAEHDIVTCMEATQSVYSVANMYSVDAPPYIVKLKEKDWSKRCCKVAARDLFVCPHQIAAANAASSVEQSRATWPFSPTKCRTSVQKNI